MLKYEDEVLFESAVINEFLDEINATVHHACICITKSQR